MIFTDSRLTREHPEDELAAEATAHRRTADVFDALAGFLTEHPDLGPLSGWTSIGPLVPNGDWRSTGQLPIPELTGYQVMRVPLDLCDDQGEDLPVPPRIEREAWIACWREAMPDQVIASDTLNVWIILPEHGFVVFITARAMAEGDAEPPEPETGT